MSRIVAWFTELSYRRAGFVVAAIALVLGAGALSATRINQELIPDIEFPLIVVVAQAPETQPGEVVRSTIAPIEAATANLDGLQSTQSTSVQGLGVLMLLFDFGVDLQGAEEEVQALLQSLPIPPGVQTSTLLLDPATLPVIMATLEGNASDQELLALAQGRVVPRLAEIDGIGSVDVVGGALEQVRVAVDRNALLERGLSYEAIAATLRANNVILPAGFVAGEESVIPVEAVLAFSSLEELGEVAVPLPQGGTVALDEIATIDVVETTPTGVNRSNGTPAVGLQIAKTKEANTVAVAHAVLDAFADLQADLPEGVRIEVVQDQAEFIEESVYDMVLKGVIGGVLAVVIVLLFLGSIRSTLVTAVSIPLSILAAIVALEATGNTLNLMTLGGLTIAIGRVIDDSIVVLESIYRHMAAGERTHTAVTRGAREVTLAIVGATATTAAVFLPLGLVGGIIGELFLPFALAVVFALIASLLAAVTVVPALVRILLSRGVKVHAEEEGRHGRLARAYRPALEWSLRHRWTTLGASAVLFIGSLALVPTLPLVFLPDSGENSLVVTVPARPAESRDSVLERAIAVEGMLDDYAVESYQTVISGASGGLGALGAVVSGQSPNSATITAVFDSSDPSRKVAEDLRARFPDEIEGGGDITVSTDTVGFSTSAVNITVAAQSPAAAAALPEAATMVEQALAGIDGLTNVSSDVSESVPAIELQIDQRAAAAAGLTPAQIAASVAQLSGGQQVTSVTTAEGMLPVQLALTTGGILTADQLATLPLTPDVTLGDVATPVEVMRQTTLTRIDGRSAATVGGEIVADNVSAVSLEATRAVDALDLPAGVEVNHGGVGSDIDQGFTSMLIAIGASIVLVYLIMAGLFQSWVDPFVILFTLPLAVIGAIAALWITGSSLSINAMLGMLMLVGIVVTNAIVMLEYVTMLRRERGYDVHQALVEGGQTRLRPVLMTALATMLALIPLAAGFGGSGLISAELGRVVIGGLFTSTFLTLLVVPVVYSLMDSLKRRFARAPRTDDGLANG
ncbi:MAG: efflux RND transporter permease subunit [Dehalococcoidia bacterium]|nr:efflux RND transporter permease subunit [Dehalococcoidia bacterium]